MTHLKVISWTDHVRNEEVLLRVNEQRNILHEIIKRKTNWIDHILRWNCLLKQVIEGKIKEDLEVTRSRGRRRRKLLDDLKDMRGYSHLKEKILDRTMWRNRFGGGFEPVVRQNTEWMETQCWNTFYYQLMHITLKNAELLKHSKLEKNAPTCFGLHRNHLHGAKVSSWLKITRLVDSICVNFVEP